MAHLDPPMRRYVAATLLFMSSYVTLNVLAIIGVYDRFRGGPGGWVIALAVAFPVAGQIWATIRLLRDSDEYVRALLAKRFVLAAGAAMALFSAWGFAESYADAPHAPGWLVYPLFWAAYGVFAPLVRTTR